MSNNYTQTEKYWPRRYTVIGLCFCSILLCFIDRINISIAILPMAEQFEWNNSVKGMVLSSFFIGYLFTQIPGGWLANRFGGKITLGFAVFWWSLFTILTPIMAMVSVPLLIITRIAMGIGEGMAFPAVYNMISRWIPVRERSRAVAICLSGSPLGIIAAIVFTPFIVIEMGWQWAFYLFGITGFVWLFFWWSKVPKKPGNDTSIPIKENKNILTENTDTKNTSIPWLLILSKAPVWALIINYFCVNWGLFVLMSWLPSYFSDVLDISLGNVWIYVAPPWITAFLMANVAGWCADILINNGCSTTFVRKLMQSIGLLGPAAFLFLFTQVSSAGQATILLCAVLGLAQFAVAGIGVNQLDLTPRYADILCGIANTAGTIPGIIGVALTGWLVEVTNSYTPALLLTAVIYIAGAFIWLIFSTGEKIID